MRRITFSVLLLAFLVSFIPSVGAAPNSAGKPTHGCDQADENDGDVYDSTCDGSPSGNGNGGGNANGKACAGCEGAADNKNPQGQLPNAEEDGNNGYECDGNSGIARGNPAHSACEPYSGAAAPARTKKIDGSAASVFRLFEPATREDSTRWIVIAAAVLIAFMLTGSHLWGKKR